MMATENGKSSKSTGPRDTCCAEPTDRFKDRIARLSDKGKLCALGGDPVDEWMDVGPAEASYLLSISPGNRSVSDIVVGRYVREIEEGRWQRTHQGFGVDWTGAFRDGHHRCTAIVRAKKTVRVRITFGLAPDAIALATDQGAVRSIAQQLHMKYGLKDQHRVVATVRSFMNLCRPSRSGIQYSVTEIEKGLELCKNALVDVRPVMKSGFPASLAGACILAWFIEPDAVRSFAEDVSRGTGLSGDDPAWIMREYVKKADTAGGQNSRAVSTRALYAIRARIEGRRLSRFSATEESTVIDWFLKQKKSLKAVTP